MIFQVSHNRVSEADPMRPTVVVTVYPLLITVKSKPGYSGALEKIRTPDILITNQALYQLSYKGNTLFTLQYTV